MIQFHKDWCSRLCAHIENKSKIMKANLKSIHCPLITGYYICKNLYTLLYYNYNRIECVTNGNYLNQWSNK